MTKKYCISPKECKIILKAAEKVGKSLCKTNGFYVNEIDVLGAFMMIINRCARLTDAQNIEDFLCKISPVVELDEYGNEKEMEVA